MFVLRLYFCVLMYIWVEGVNSTSVKNRYFDQFPGLFDGFMDEDFLRNTDTDSIEFPGSIFSAGGDFPAKINQVLDAKNSTTQSKLIGADDVPPQNNNSNIGANAIINTGPITSSSLSTSASTYADNIYASTDNYNQYTTRVAAAAAAAAGYLNNNRYANPEPSYANNVDNYPNYVNNPDNYLRSRNNLGANYNNNPNPNYMQNNMPEGYSTNPYYQDSVRNPSGIIEGDLEDVNESICMRISMQSLIAFFKKMDETRRELSGAFLQNGLEYNEFSEYKVMYKNLQKAEAKIERCINCIVAQEKEFSGFWQTAKIIFYHSMTKSARDKLFEKRMEFYVDVFLGSKDLEKMVKMYELIEIHQSLLDKFESEIIQYAAQHCIKSQLQYEV